MTVVTAFAVSWNPLMNSNRNATNSAAKRKRTGPVPSPTTASQKVMRHPLGDWGVTVPHRVIRGAGPGHAKPERIQENFTTRPTRDAGAPRAARGLLLQPRPTGDGDGLHPDTLKPEIPI